MRFLFLDTETTGLHEDADLLTLCMKSDDKYLDLQVKPTRVNSSGEGIYCVNPAALAVNKIDLKAHDVVAVPPTDLESTIEQYLRHRSQNFKGFVDNKPVVTTEKLTPVGHNVSWDLGILKRTFPGVNFDKYLSHVVFDTLIIAKFLAYAGIIPNLPSFSLSSLCEYFDINTDNAHNAREDVEMTEGLFNALLSSLPRVR